MLAGPKNRLPAETVVQSTSTADIQSTQERLGPSRRRFSPYVKAAACNRANRFLLAGLLAVAIPNLTGCTTRCERHSSKPATEQVTAAEQMQPAATTEAQTNGPHRAGLAENWGIEPLGVRLSAAGYMLDFRYRVTDPQKAMPIMESRTSPWLIHQRTGARLRVPSPPKVGPLRQRSRQPDPGRVYFTLFANPGRLVKPNDKVTIAIADCRIENLVVE